MISWKKYALLHKKKERFTEKKIIIEGVRICSEAMISDWNIEAIFVSEKLVDSSEWYQLENQLTQSQKIYRILPDVNFKKLSRTENPQGILMVMNMPDQNLDTFNFHSAKFILLLESIRDPGNLGTIIRTADWFGVDAIILSEETVDPYNDKVLRSTMGAIFNVPIFQSNKIQDVVLQLKSTEFCVIASALDAKTPLNSTQLNKSIALILGGEAQGISEPLQKMADLTVKIRQDGKAESLNVAIAGGIFMNHIAEEIYKQTGKKNEH